MQSSRGHEPNQKRDAEPQQRKDAVFPPQQQPDAAYEEHVGEEKRRQAQNEDAPRESTVVEEQTQALRRQGGYEVDGEEEAREGRRHYGPATIVIGHRRQRVRLRRPGDGVIFVESGRKTSVKQNPDSISSGSDGRDGLAFPQVMESNDGRWMEGIIMGMAG